MEKRKWLKIFLFSIVIFIIITTLLLHYKRYWIVAFSDLNTVPMYKFNSYEDYKKNRPAYLAEANDNFVNDTLNPNQDFDDGVVDDVVFASNHFIKEGFAYMPKDYAAGMKRLNQAWLIAPDNYNVYWGFAVWERNYAGDCDAARNFLEKATEYYNERYKIKDGDRDRLEKTKTSLLSGC